MQRTQVEELANKWFGKVRRLWLHLTREDRLGTQWQLERMIDGVCDRYNVARHTVEQEIYNGLLLLSAGNAPLPAKIRRAE